MRKLLLGLCLLLAVQSLSAQEKTVTGKVTDTLERRDLSNAVVSIIKKSDSTLVAFTRSDRQGQFRMSGIAAGKYILLVTYPKYAGFADEIEVKDQDLTELGSVALTLRSKLLQAVVIRSTGSIRIKGDTTEYVADSFAVREGATVEELLKKMPGFQVNSKGEITAQGQRVQKVLVDGEEFFGDDPTMATQNISAKAVDKVQVFDTKTEQQQLTGISTGTEGKTVNIKLKEDAKKGAFGKGHASSNFNDLVDAKALYNRFVGKRKVSLYGTKSDISTGSLNWDDRRKLGLENDFEYDEISGYYFSFGSDDGFNDWGLRGLPESYTAGGLFTNKWNEDKHNVNTSYRYNYLATRNTASTLTQNILPNAITYRNRFQNTNGLNRQHSVNGKYEWKVDSLASFRFITAGTYKMTGQESDMNSEFLGGDRMLTNRSEQLRSNETRKLQSDNQLVYKQLFRKKNRQLMATLRFGLVGDDQDGVVRTRTEFYQNGIIDSVDVADQQKKMEGQSRTMGSKLTFSEPLSNTWNMVVDYAYNHNNSTSFRNTYNKDFDGKYAVLDSAFSNNFDLTAASHSGTTIFRYTDKKWRMAFGSGISGVRLNLLDLNKDSRRTYNFLNLTPQVQLAYTLKAQTNLSFRYRGTTRQPTIDQLQPIRDNTDRLNEFIGNPDLKVGFNHNFNLGFNSYKTLKASGIFMGLHYSLTDNAITFLNTIDLSTGAQTYKPVNVNGNSNWGVWGDWFKGEGENVLQYGINTNSRGGRNINFINGTRNVTNYVNLDMGIRLHYETQKYGGGISPRVGWNNSSSSLMPTQDTRYMEYGGQVEGFIKLPGKLELRSDCNFQLRQRINDFDTNPSQVIWHANLSRQVFKDKSGKIMLVANDILNEDRGFNRNITNNFISEERYSRISRYFFLRFEWSFNKMPGQNAENN
ncbi:MAG TPA: outer membrane beta-barrel protein [Flavisolibacter sp.]|jgi:hypothetical protein